MKKGDRKKTNKPKKKDEGQELINNFVAFGNRRNVFWGITIATIIISIIGIPVMIDNQDFLKRFLVIWILEIIYIAMWIRMGDRKKKKLR
jgi:uncharacterized membrane protein YkvI